MKRAVGTALFGLGVLFLVLAIGLPVYVAPAVTKLPYDLKRSESRVEAKNATFLQNTKEESVVHTNLDLVSITTVVPQPGLTDQLQKEFKDSAVVWDVYSSTARADNGQKISESTTEIALDRVTGVPVGWSGAWVNDGTKTTTRFQGQIYKFPFHTEKKDYAYWDGELGTAPPAKFEAVDEVGGVEVYRFKQNIDWFKTTIDDTTRSFLLSKFGDKTATTGDIYYKNTRTFWVEPVTGQFLDLREQRQQEFRDDVGTVTTLLNADFRYSKGTVDNSVKTAKENKTLIQAVSVYAPIGLGILGLILVVVGPLLMRRRDPSTF